MKIITLSLASAAALLAGAAMAQPPQPAPAPTPGSVTGDWNGAHAPSDDKQYRSSVTVPLGSTPAAGASATASSEATTSATSSVETPAPAASSIGSDVSATAPGASFTSMTVTNGPVPDTAENRAKYGQPMSRAGKRTAARGN